MLINMKMLILFPVLAAVSMLCGCDEMKGVVREKLEDIPWTTREVLTLHIETQGLI